MRRDDLSKGNDGWQVLDPTPQELSDGTFLMFNLISVFHLSSTFLNFSTLKTETWTSHLLITRNCPQDVHCSFFGIISSLVFPVGLIIKLTKRVFALQVSSAAVRVQ